MARVHFHFKGKSKKIRHSFLEPKNMYICLMCIITKEPEATSESGALQFCGGRGSPKRTQLPPREKRNIRWGAQKGTPVPLQRQD